jgi:hypothetical protein
MKFQYDWPVDTARDLAPTADPFVCFFLMAVAKLSHDKIHDKILSY